jgi:hypothetical protein
MLKTDTEGFDLEVLKGASPIGMLLSTVLCAFDLIELDRFTHDRDHYRPHPPAREPRERISPKGGVSAIFRANCHDPVQIRKWHTFDSEMSEVILRAASDRRRPIKCICQY